MQTIEPGTGAGTELENDPSADQAAARPGPESTAMLRGLGVMRPILALVTNVSVLTALLFYFGWRRTATQDLRLGLDPELFGLGPQDYLLRSVGPVLNLLAVLAVIGLTASYLHPVLLKVIEDRPATSRLRRSITWSLSSAWLVVPGLLLVANRSWPSNGYIYEAFPLGIGAGVALLLYREHLAGRLSPSGPRRTTLDVATISVAALCVISIFWATSNYAEVEGNQAADAFIANPQQYGLVTVYSKQPLSLPVSQETLPNGAGAGYNYRYRGLWLMAMTGQRYFLIPGGWTPGASPVVMLKEDADGIRLEFGSA